MERRSPETLFIDMFYFIEFIGSYFLRGFVHRAHEELLSGLQGICMAGNSQVNY